MEIKPEVKALSDEELLRKLDSIERVVEYWMNTNIMDLETTKQFLEELRAERARRNLPPT